MDFQLIAAPPLYFQVALNLGETAPLISLGRIFQFLTVLGKCEFEKYDWWWEVLSWKSAGLKLRVK